MGRSQRHKVYIQGVASDGVWEAEGVVGNLAVAGADGGPLQGSTVPGPEPGIPGEDSSGGGGPPAVTGILPNAATQTAAGAVGRTLITLTGQGGTPPFTYSAPAVAGLSSAIVGNILQTTLDPAGAVGTYQVPITATDSEGESKTENVALTLT